MTETLRPETEEQLVEAINWSATAPVPAPLEIIGLGSKRALGRPVSPDVRPAPSNEPLRVLDLSAMWGITHYEPSELVLSARVGTPLAEIQHAIAQNNQTLAFEPMDTAALLGQEANADGYNLGSIGGLVAAGYAGSRRIRQGSIRDHVLGFRAVSGRGELFKSGGRVMKNVTGFDLSKLMTASHGTLAVMSEVTLKVLPAAEKTRTVLVFGLSDDVAGQAMSDAMNSPYEVSSAAHLQMSVARRCAVPMVSDANAPVTAIRVEGPDPSVIARCAALREMLGKYGEIEELHTSRSNALWREARDAAFFKAPFAQADSADQVWRISVAPSAGASVTKQIIEACGGEAFYDLGGGLIWLALSPRNDASVDIVRGAVAAFGGHATLMRASEAVRRSVAVFQPQPASLAALSARVKDAFDPHRILNPGRMYAEL